MKTKANGFLVILTLVASGIFLTNCASSPRNPTELKVPGNLHDVVPFVSHRGSGPMQNYLAQNIQEKAVEKIRIELENRIQQKLLHRKEAHLTVITPIEYDQVLSQKLKMADIDALAKKMKIQDSTFKPICMGRGSLTIEGTEQSTYYLVVDSEASFRLRHAIQDLYINRGGKPDIFNPDHFYPHITVAYTQRDLHYEDGVIKDERSCIFSLEEQK